MFLVKTDSTAKGAKKNKEFKLFLRALRVLGGENL
jgi:hypothetical protein